MTVYWSVGGGRDRIEGMGTEAVLRALAEPNRQAILKLVRDRVTDDDVLRLCIGAVGEGPLGVTDDAAAGVRQRLSGVHEVPAFFELLHPRLPSAHALLELLRRGVLSRRPAVQEHELGHSWFLLSGEAAATMRGGAHSPT
jgi:hypothetical protein